MRPTRLVGFSMTLYSMSYTQYECKRLGQTHTIVIFTYCLENTCLAAFANDSRWRIIQVRGMLHSELYASQSLTIPFFPFSFVSHVDHLLISLKIGGICKHKGHYNLCKIPRKHSYVDTLLHFSASKALSSHAGH